MEEYKLKINELENEQSSKSSNSSMEFKNYHHHYQQSVDDLGKTTLQLQAKIAEYHIRTTSQSEVCFVIVIQFCVYDGWVLCI